MEHLKNEFKLIHIASILSENGLQYLFLRRHDPVNFIWYADQKATSVKGISIEEAIYNARKHWQHDHFRTINCGFRYSLPERDEHGCNALYHQMAASYSMPNGVYFDEDLGHNCIVHFASEEARQIWQQQK